jgi:hypothetical protein
MKWENKKHKKCFSVIFHLNDSCKVHDVARREEKTEQHQFVGTFDLPTHPYD